MNIYLEIFGYIGTALVLISMLMTSVVKLRIFNAVGSLVSMIYAYMCNTWPVVFLNGSLLVINVVQLILLKRTKVSFSYTPVNPEDMSLAYFLSCFREDIRLYFPEFDGTVLPDRQVHMVFCGAEPVGVLIGRPEGDSLAVELDYSTPKYRDCSVAAFLFATLKDRGVRTLSATGTTTAHAAYLEKMGFRDQNGTKVKTL